jgi:hypothetical protein
VPEAEPGSGSEEAEEEQDLEPGSVAVEEEVPGSDSDDAAA